jgi:hypothetical protein
MGGTFQIGAFHRINTGKSRVVFGIGINDMIKVFFVTFLNLGFQYTDPLFGNSFIYIFTETAIICKFIGVLGINTDIIHIVAFGTETHIVIIRRRSRFYNIIYIYICIFIYDLGRVSILL